MQMVQFENLGAIHLLNHSILWSIMECLFSVFLSPTCREPVAASLSPRRTAIRLISHEL